MAVRIGIDFGTTFSFAGFLHGDQVMPLIPSRETYGIPSLFYYDGKNMLVGRTAERRAENHPEFAVRSIKRRLMEGDLSEIILAGRKFSLSEIVTQIISYIVGCAEQQLENIYMEEYEEMEAVITVPVDATEPMKQLIVQAAEQVTLKNGKKLCITGVLPEPDAAAIEYFGVKKENNANILVFDLGGGTFDASIVQARKDSVPPYVVKDHEGDRKLGGDDWDEALAARLREEFQRQTDTAMNENLKVKILTEAKRVKEELSEKAIESSTAEISYRGEYISVEVSRAEFENLTKPLLKRAMKKVEILLKRQEEAIDHVILTGGSSYMPQIQEAIRRSTLFQKGIDIRLYEPEHAIAYGGARYAATRVWDEDCGQVQAEREIIKQIATKGYGIVYRYPEKENKLLIRTLIPKGSHLPFCATAKSSTFYDNQSESVFRVCELDEESKQGELVEISKGTTVMAPVLKWGKAMPKGTKSVETLTLSEEGRLSIRSVSEYKGIQVENEVLLNRVLR